MADQSELALGIRISATNETAQAAEAARKQIHGVTEEIRAARRAAAEGGGIRESLEEIKSQVGRGSTFAELSELAKGGGIAIGLHYATENLKAMAEGAARFTDELARGDKTAGQLADGLLRSLPVLGNIYIAGQSIREMFTGEEATTEAINRSAEAANKYVDDRLQLLKDEAEAHEKILKIIQDENRERAKVGMTGSQRGEADAQDSAEQRRKKILDDAAEAAKKRQSEWLAIRQNLIAQRNADAAIVPAKDWVTDSDDQKKENHRLRDEISHDDAALSSMDKYKNREDSNAKNDVNAALSADAALAAREEQQRQIDEQKQVAEEHIKAVGDEQSKQAEIRAAGLRSLGKDLDAEIVLRRDKLRKEQEEIEAERQQQIQEHPDAAQQFNFDATQKSGLAAAADVSDENEMRNKDREEKTRKAEEKQLAAADFQQQVERAAHDSRMQWLQAEADSGDATAKKRIHDEEVIEKFKQRNADLQKLIDDPRTTAAQRGQLQQAQQNARGQEVLDLIGQTHNPYAEKFASAQESRFGSGANDVLRQSAHEDPNAKAIKGMQDSINKLIAGFATPAQWDALWQALITKLPQISATNSAQPNPIW